MLAHINYALQRQIILNRLELGNRVADSANWYYCVGWLKNA